MWNTYVPQNAKRCFFKSNELTEFEMTFQEIEARQFRTAVIQLFGQIILFQTGKESNVYVYFECQNCYVKISPTVLTSKQK